MYYKMTQLKDLPDSPAGTVFECKEHKDDRQYRPGVYWIANAEEKRYSENGSRKKWTWIGHPI